MVLGICSIVFAYPFFGTVIAIIGLVLGVSGKRKLIDHGAPTGVATAGIVMSIIGLALSVLIWVACATCTAAMFNSSSANIWNYF
jgi:hypothetical protein